jgi:hypothetical protein
MLDMNPPSLTAAFAPVPVRNDEIIGRDTISSDPKVGIGAGRVKIERAVEILGLATRTVQKMSQRGELPGAALMGRRWTYNEGKLHDYVRNQERESWQQSQRRKKLRPDATGRTAFSITGLRSAAGDSEDRYSQAILFAQSNSASRRKKN